MKGKRKYLLAAVLSFLLVPPAYTISYLRNSSEGRYEPVAYGLMQGPDGSNILVPKGAFGYRWTPFDQFTDDGRTKLITYIYLPAIKLDQLFWHTEERMESGRYRVHNYFDYETLSYRDIEPK